MPSDSSQRKNTLHFLNTLHFFLVLEQTSQPKLDVFQELLGKYPGVFHQARTPKSLLVHWQLLKQYYLLDDQTGGFC